MKTLKQIVTTMKLRKPTLEEQIHILIAIVFALFLVVCDLAHSVTQCQQATKNLQNGIDAAIAATVNGSYEPPTTETPLED